MIGKGNKHSESTHIILSLHFDWRYIRVWIGLDLMLAVLLHLIKLQCLHLRIQLFLPVRGYWLVNFRIYF